MSPTPIALRAAAVLTLALGGCASWPGTNDASNIIVVRHAEKVADGSDDPALTDAGKARAEAISRWLSDSDVVAVYSSDTRRTRQTATPTAESHGVPVILYDADTAAEQLAARLRQAHPRGTVLVVGHSNTAPGIAAALCGCPVEPMSEEEYGRRMTVHTDGDGDITLLTAPLPTP